MKKIRRMSQDDKEKAMKMYLEGMSIRGIERRLSFSHVSILKYIKKQEK
jgi:transposase-like protein